MQLSKTVLPLLLNHSVSHYCYYYYYYYYYWLAGWHAENPLLLAVTVSHDLGITGAFSLGMPQQRWPSNVLESLRY